MVIESVRPWLGVVETDLKAIRNNLYGPDPVPTAAAYHCQQAAEKLVKAVLVSLGRNPPKIHNIVALIDDIPRDHALRPRLVPLERFTPFVAVFRYPGASPFDEPPDEPTIDEVASWRAEIEAARDEVVRFLGLG